MQRKLITLATLALLSFPGISFGQGDEKGKGGRREMPRPGGAAGRMPGGQPGGGPGAAFGGGAAGIEMMMKMFPVMAALDTDQDGVLSAGEIENSSKALLKLDRDGDGTLSPEELRPDPSKMGGMMGMVGGAAGGPMPGQPNPLMMMKMFENRDANGDGKLSGDEIPEQMQGRLKMIDQDGDGAVQKSEMERAASMMADRGGQRPGRGNGNDGSGVKPKRPPQPE